MGSSLVKPSRREPLRRGAANAARSSSSRSDARLNNGTNDGQKDEWYKVDPLTGPISNYCKPVTVISQSESTTNKTIPEQVGNNVSKAEGLRVNGVVNKQNGSQEYVSPVLKKDFSGEETQLPKVPIPTSGNSKSSATGRGDSSVPGLPPIVTGQQKPPPRRRKFLSGSCVGRRNDNVDLTDSDKVESNKQPIEKEGLASKGKIVLTKSTESELDDQDVSRDARTPSPEYNDFENVIVTKPTSLKIRSSASSPVDFYVHSKDTAYVEEISPAGVSIRKSQIPAPLHQGERRCELNKNLFPKTSSSALSYYHEREGVQGQGDTHAMLDSAVSSKTKLEQESSLHSDLETSKSYEQGEGDPASLKVEGCKQYEKLSAKDFSVNEKELLRDAGYESSFKFSEENADVHNESYPPQSNAVFITVQPKEQLVLSLKENDKTAAEEKNLTSMPDKDSAKGNNYEKSGVINGMIGDYSTDTAASKRAIEDQVYVCANVHLETRTLSDIKGLQGCAAGATKCFCDVSQFDYDNKDDIPNIQNLGAEGIKSWIQIRDQKLTDTKLSAIERKRDAQPPMKPEQDIESADLRAGNKSEEDMSPPGRGGRLNCWRPESGGCASAAKPDREGQARGEHRPASCSKISLEQQSVDAQQVGARSCSAATGDNNTWGTGAASAAGMAPLSTSSSRLNASRSQLNSSSPRQCMSQASAEIDKSSHSADMEASEASSKSPSARDTRRRPTTSKTSLADDKEVSLKTTSTHDLGRPQPAHSVSSGRLQRSRPSSAQSMHGSQVGPVENASHQSLGRLSAYSSRHNLSRSLSNHSSGHLAMRSPRPPSTEPARLSPRPPSDHSSAGGGVRKIRSRPSLVQISGGAPTATSREPSIHSLSHNPLETPSFQRILAQTQNYPPNKTDGTSPGQGSITASLNFESPVKLPPIRTSTNTVSMPDSWAPPGQQVRLPPVVRAGSVPRLPETSDVSTAATTDDQILTASRKSCGVLPEIGGRVDKERCNSLAEAGNEEESTEFQSKSDSGKQGYKGSFSYERPSYVETIKVKPFPAAKEDIKDSLQTEKETEYPLQDKSEEGDPKPSPSDSHTGVDGKSEPVVAETTEDLARLLAMYLPHKYSATKESAAPGTASAGGDAIGAGLNDTASVANNFTDNKASRDDSTAGHCETKIDYTKCTTRCSDLGLSDHASICSEQEKCFENRSAEVGDDKYSTNVLSETKAECNEGESDVVGKSEVSNENETQEGRNVLTTSETVADWKPSSPTLPEYDSLLAKYSTSAKRDNHDNENATGIREDTTKTDETSTACMESTTEWRSDLPSRPDYTDLLAKYSTTRKEADADVECSEGLPDGKHTTEIDAIQREMTDSADQLEGRSMFLPDSTSYQFKYSPIRSEDKMNVENAADSSEASVAEENKYDQLSVSDAACKTSTPSTFDYAALMAKYSSGSTEHKYDMEGTMTTSYKDISTVSKENVGSAEENANLDHGNTDSVDKDVVPADTGSDSAYQETDVAKNSSGSTEQTTVFDIASLMAKYSTNKPETAPEESKDVAIRDNKASDIDYTTYSSRTTTESFNYISGLEDSTAERNPSLNNDLPVEPKEHSAENKGFSDSIVSSDNMEGTHVEAVNAVADITNDIAERVFDLANHSPVSSGSMKDLESRIEGDSAAKAERSATPISLIDVPQNISGTKSPPGNDPPLAEEALSAAQEDTHVTSENAAVKDNDAPAAETPIMIKETETPTEVEEAGTEATPYSVAIRATPATTDEDAKENNSVCAGENVQINEKVYNYTSDSVPFSTDDNTDLANQYRSSDDNGHANTGHGIPGTVSKTIGEESENLLQDAPKIESEMKASCENVDGQEEPLKCAFAEDSRPEGDYLKEDGFETREKEDSPPTEDMTHDVEENALPDSEELQNDEESIVHESKPGHFEPDSAAQIGTGEALSGPEEFQTSSGDPPPQNETFSSNKSPIHEEVSPDDCGSHMSEEGAENVESAEPNDVPENLPSERINTIKKQIYEEGLKPCQRDGGVAFFIPVSNTGLQPANTTPDIGERLAKPKKPSLSYEERMMMADINRHNQLSKKKEFAVKDLINVKTATTSSASASGENISGAADRSDRSDAGSSLR